MDPLKEYREKRSFADTPEPAPGAAGEAKPQRRFCLQRHRARRLHYDLRLEHNGVLKSWAVPKGPSLTATDKRLAVATEDHPLEYLEWEGVIPEGHYGAGSMLVFDLGTYELGDEQSFDEQYARGDLKLVLTGTKVRGTFALVRTSAQQWLLIKKTDAECDPDWDPEQHAWSVLTGCNTAEIEAGRDCPAPTLTQIPPRARQTPMPGSIEPMLARSSEPFDNDDWSFEIKWDGFRVLAFGRGPTLRLTSRRGNSMTRQFPELLGLRAQMQAESFIVDGEIVVLDDDGVPDFQKLAPRMHSQKSLAHITPAVLYVFDLLYLDGFDLRPMPLVERRKLLEAVLRPNRTVRLSEAVLGQGKALFALAEQRSLEGLVAKRLAASYQPGRSDDWLKIKTEQLLDCVICGYTDPKGGRVAFGSLVLGRFEGNHLVHVGNAGSGLKTTQLRELGADLKGRATDACPFAEEPKLDDPVTWVRPELVCEIRHSSFSDSGLVRFPVFHRLRPDLDPEVCTSNDELAARSGQQLKDQQIRRFSNRDKLIFPDDGITKGELIDYYDAVSAYILPHLVDRPLSLKRYPNGIHKKFFFQKHPGAGFPDWIATVPIKGQECILCNDRETLLYLANLACIDQNPALSRVNTLEIPDFMVFDLDPVADDAFDDLIAGALELRDLLQRIGLKSHLKTSGSRGLHVFVGLAPRYTFQQSRLFAQVIGQALIGLHPKRFTMNRNPEKREASIYLDIPQNRQGGTLAGVYSVRAIPGAYVSTPVSWEEAEAGIDFRDFHLRNTVQRLERVGDLFSPLLGEHQQIETAVGALEEVQSGKTS